VPTSTPPPSMPSRPPRFVVPQPAPTPSRRIPHFLPATAAVAVAVRTPSRPIFQATPQHETIDDDDDIAGTSGRSSRQHLKRRWSSTSAEEGGEAEERGSMRALPFAPGSTAAAAAAATAAATPISARLLALRPPSPPRDPLPPADWSPSKPRRGAYVPSGLAATVARWAVDARNAQGRRAPAIYTVDRVRAGDGFAAVRARDAALLLAPCAAAAEVAVGTRICVEWPWWDVDVDGALWRVCVFWEVVRAQEGMA